MAARFTDLVSDVKEVSLHAEAIPQNTKASTEWSLKCAISDLLYTFSAI